MYVLTNHTLSTMHKKSLNYNCVKEIIEKVVFVGQTSELTRISPSELLFIRIKGFFFIA